MAGGGSERSQKTDQSGPKGSPGRTRTRRTKSQEDTRRKLDEEVRSKGRNNNRSKHHGPGEGRERGRRHQPAEPPPTLLPPTELLLSTERETRQANKRIRDEVEEDRTAMEDSEYEEAEEMSPPRKK